MNLSPQALKIVNRACQLMRKYPHRYDQTDPTRPSLSKRSSTCGVVGCIAGFIHTAAAQLRVGTPVQVGDISRSAETAQLLGVGRNEALRFFCTGSWPRQFFYALDVAKTNRAKATIAIRRMRHWAKTGQ